MNKFIKTVLDTNHIRNDLLNFKENYNGISYDDVFKKLMNSKNKEVRFIIKYTQWLFIDNNDNLYGSLSKFILRINKDCQITFICEGFRNLPLILNTKKENNKENNKEKVWNDYIKICNTYNLELSDKNKEEDFKKYLNDFV